MELSEQFSAMQQAYQMHPYPSSQERKTVLKAIKKLLQNKAYTLAEAVNKDFTHRATQETLFLEIFPSIKAIEFCLKHLKPWMKRRKRHVSWLLKPAQAYLFAQPLGVVGIMVPWNFPIYLALVPAIYALAAGNRVMIKMSELSSNTGLALQSLIQTLELNHFIQVIDGDVELAKQFAALPFGHLLFTGSTQVGKQIMKAASENLTPVTLELGGKSPAVVSATMNPHYFNRLFMGKFFNAAQTCVAPDYLLIPSGWEKQLEDQLKQFVDRYYPELMSNNDYSAIISKTHQQRLEHLIDDAINKGARVITYGKLNPQTNKMPMHLLFDVTEDMLLMQEEIFGPILPVLTYKSFSEAVEYIKSHPNPLALYYFGENKEEVDVLRTQTLSGALTINETLMHLAVDDLPFGGVGCSGMGSYHGQEGFDTFSKVKPIFVQNRLSSLGLTYPPYKQSIHLLLKWIGGIKGSQRE